MQSHRYYCTPCHSDSIHKVCQPFETWFWTAPMLLSLFPPCFPKPQFANFMTISLSGVYKQIGTWGNLSPGTGFLWQTWNLEPALCVPGIGCWGADSGTQAHGAAHDLTWKTDNNSRRVWLPLSLTYLTYMFSEIWGFSAEDRWSHLSAHCSDRNQQVSIFKNAFFCKQSAWQSGSRDRRVLQYCVMRLEADRGPEDGRQRLEAPARLRLAMRGHGPCQLTKLMTPTTRLRN